MPWRWRGPGPRRSRSVAAVTTWPGTRRSTTACMIDLSPMKGIHVDVRASTGCAQGGVLWKELNRETQIHGLATTGGVVGSTGIAGLTLGGGVGWLMPKHGWPWTTCGRRISSWRTAGSFGPAPTRIPTSSGPSVAAAELRHRRLSRVRPAPGWPGHHRRRRRPPDVPRAGRAEVLPRHMCGSPG